MAENTTTQSAKRKLGWIGGIAAFFTGLIIWGVASGQPGASYTPELALDLQGGTSIILTPTLADGESVDPEQLNQALEIIRQRIDGTGVSEAQVSIQGEQNILVSIPGTPDASTLQLIKASALLEFRPVDAKRIRMKLEKHRFPTSKFYGRGIGIICRFDNDHFIAITHEG